MAGNGKEEVMEVCPRCMLANTKKYRFCYCCHYKLAVSRSGGSSSVPNLKNSSSSSSSSYKPATQFRSTSKLPFKVVASKPNKKQEEKPVAEKKVEPEKNDESKTEPRKNEQKVEPEKKDQPKEPEKKDEPKVEPEKKDESQVEPEKKDESQEQPEKGEPKESKKDEPKESEKDEPKQELPQTKDEPAMKLDKVQPEQEKQSEKIEQKEPEKDESKQEEQPEKNEINEEPKKNDRAEVDSEKDQPEVVEEVEKTDKPTQEETKKDDEPEKKDEPKKVDANDEPKQKESEKDETEKNDETKKGIVPVVTITVEGESEKKVVKPEKSGKKKKHKKDETKHDSKKKDEQPKKSDKDSERKHHAKQASLTKKDHPRKTLALRKSSSVPDGLTRSPSKKAGDSTLKEPNQVTDSPLKETSRKHKHEHSGLAKNDGESKSGEKHKKHKHAGKESSADKLKSNSHHLSLKVEIEPDNCSGKLTQSDSSGSEKPSPSNVAVERVKEKEHRKSLSSSACEDKLSTSFREDVATSPLVVKEPLTPTHGHRHKRVVVKNQMESEPSDGGRGMRLSTVSRGSVEVVNMRESYAERERKEIESLYTPVRSPRFFSPLQGLAGKAADLAQTPSKVQDPIPFKQRPMACMMIGKQGYLRVKEKSSWNRRYVVVTPNHCHIFQSEIDQEEPRLSLDLMFVGIREEINVKERDCAGFQIVTRDQPVAFRPPSHCPNPQLLIKEWVEFLRHTAEMLVESTAHPDNAPYREKLQEVMARPENALCVDCGDPGPVWASTNLGCFMCIKCSGIHRGLGVHISQVRSTTMDTWTDDLIKSMMDSPGNVKINEYYEATLPPGRKISPSSSDDERKKFIEDKYAHLMFIPEEEKKLRAVQQPTPTTTTTSPPASPSSAAVKAAVNTRDAIVDMFEHDSEFRSAVAEFLFAPENAAQFKSALKTALDDPEIRDALKGILNQ